MKLCNLGTSIPKEHEHKMYKLKVFPQKIRSTKHLGYICDALFHLIWLLLITYLAYGKKF